jgi:hypothetical protein
MARYYVHTKKDDDGDHEVHDSNCSWLPKPSHRVDLGYHTHCSSAVKAAERKGYKPTNGCAHCSEDCHTS